jgi:hypothetical protein
MIIFSPYLISPHIPVRIEENAYRQRVPEEKGKSGIRDEIAFVINLVIYFLPFR